MELLEERLPELVGAAALFCCLVTVDELLLVRGVVYVVVDGVEVLVRELEFVFTLLLWRYGVLLVVVVRLLSDDVAARV